MTGYGGFFLKGMAGGMQSGFEMGWKKKQQKKLEEEEKKIIEGTTLFNNQIKLYGEDGLYTDDEVAMINTAWLAAGVEIQERTKGTRDAIQTMNQSKVEQDFEWLDLISTSMDGWDPKDAKGIFNYVRPYITTEKGKNYYNAYEKMYEAKYKAAQNQPTPEVFTSPSGVQGAYPEAGYEYNATAKGYVPTYQKPQEVKAPDIDVLTKATNILKTAVNAPPAQFEVLKANVSKTYNVDLSGITQGSLKEPVKPKEGGEPRTTSLPQQEEYRTKALNADTWEEAQGYINDYTQAGYDETQLGITQQDWVNAKKQNMDAIVEMLNNIYPNGKLQKDKEYTFQMNGKDVTKTGAEWYKYLYQFYQPMLDILKGNGVDISQYPVMQSFEEVSKNWFQKRFEQYKKGVLQQQ
jgi:hypothetical protein